MSKARQYGCQKAFLFTIFMVYSNFMEAQWNANAGVMPSYTTTATISSSSVGSGLANVLDNNVNTQWQSDAPLPSGFIGRADQNYVYNLGTTICTGTGSNYNLITDGNTNTAASIALQTGKAVLKMDFGIGRTFYTTTLKLSTSAGVSVYAFTSATDSTLIGTYTTANNYSLQRYNFPTATIKQLKCYSSASFQAFELAILADLPKEWVTLDLGAQKNIGQIITRHWSGGAANATATELLVSSDNLNWTSVANLVPDALQPVITQITPTRTARYIRLAHTLPIADWNKVYIWEIDAYNADGQFGAFPTTAQSPTTFKEVLGVNGIWGWGHNAYSNLLGANEGPRLYNQVAGHARNYHSMEWDVNDPDNAPDYVTMAAGGGTQGQWWLNWNQEYNNWVSAGLKVQASIQFFYPESNWNTPYQSAYTYGYNFARHFGPTHGTGAITTMEVGNEPWMYTPATYKEILRGMAKGAKAADPAIEVLPCALQAADPATDLVSSTQNYMGSHLTAAEAPYLDGLNVHSYSYINNAQGVRIETMPEDPKSDIRSILAAIRFRNINMPNKKIYWSEFGWDTDGVGEPCTHNECVSERAGTAYAVRAALMGWRWGIDRMTWFFYANDVNGSSLYTRSGLTLSRNNNFQKKTIFTAFQALLSQIQNDYFLGTVKEDDTAWIYAFGDANGNPTHLIAWRPIQGDDLTTTTVSFPYSKSALSAVRLAGINATGEPIATPTYSNGALNLTLGAMPIIVKLQNIVNTSTVDNTSLISIFPNPASKKFAIQSSEKITRIVIYDILGREILRQSPTITADIQEINTTDFTKGAYIVEILTANNERICKKVWIEE